MIRKFFLCFGILILLFSLTSFGDSTNIISPISNTTITEFNNTLSLSHTNITVFVPPNGEVIENFDIEAEYPGNMGLNTTVFKGGNVSDWISFNGSSYLEVFIAPGETNKINFTVSVPPFTSSELYYANISVNTSDGQFEKINITVNVTDNVGRINTTVFDSLGGRLSGASVLIWTAGVILKDTGNTDENGTYISEWLVPGEYFVEASKALFDMGSEPVTVFGNLNMSNISIILEPTGAPILDVSPSSISESVYVGAISTRTLVISNIGDLSLVNVTLRSDVSWISFSETFFSSIIPSDNKFVYAYIGPRSSVGSYSGKIIVESVNGGNKNITTFLDVSEQPTTPSSPSGGRGFAPIPIPVVKSFKISICPEEVEIVRGETELIFIGVENDGNVGLEEVSLSVSGDFEISVSPKSTELPFNTTKAFIVSIKVPENAEDKKYNYMVTASGEGISDSTTFSLIFLPIDTDLLRISLNQTISEMENLIKILLNETQRSENEGKNVSEIFSLLGQATQKLGDAKQYFSIDDLESVKLELEFVKRYSSLSVEKL